MTRASCSVNDRAIFFTPLDRPCQPVQRKRSISEPFFKRFLISRGDQDHDARVAIETMAPGRRRRAAGRGPYGDRMADRVRPAADGRYGRWERDGAAPGAVP